ncbi:hypothetical protein ACFUN8_19695 [Streptomyces sp. NPDC057307]|uniref:hypothetical protein n=1 Tax=Streptomyces sp. NPDC057307 TaxID=3346096 RepID=UPI00363C6959
MVQTLTAADDLQRELRAAAAKGNKGGRRPAVKAQKNDDVRTAYLNGRSITTPAREHDVNRGAIRTAGADLLPAHTAGRQGAPTANSSTAADPRVASAIPAQRKARREYENRVNALGA